MHDLYGKCHLYIHSSEDIYLLICILHNYLNFSSTRVVLTSLAQLYRSKLFVSTCDVSR